MESTALKLWEWTAEYEAVVAEIMEAGGELTPELEERLAQVEGAWEQKAERVALVIRNLEAEEAMLRDESKRIADRARSRGNASEALREYLLRELSRMEKTSVKTPLATITVGRSERVECVAPPESLPEEFQKVKVTPDLTALKKYLKEGHTLDGVTLEPSTFVTVR